MSQVNKVYSVSTIVLVARDLGVDEDWFSDLANVMDREDGLIWVYNPENEDGVMAFTDMGVENLTTFIAELGYRNRRLTKTDAARGLRRMNTAGL